MEPINTESSGPGTPIYDELATDIGDPLAIGPEPLAVPGPDGDPMVGTS